VLHLASGRDAWGWARNGAGARVHDRDGVASALRQRLVELHLVVLERTRVERVWSRGRENERRGWLSGLL